MTPELENKLFQRFPNLFIERNLPMTQTCMCWGIETGDGWFDILWNLCEKLEKFKGLVFTQVKEKYKGLRIYFRYDDPRNFRGLNARKKRKLKRSYKTILWLINQAEDMTLKICQNCSNSLNSQEYNDGYWSVEECEKCKVE